MRFKTKLFLIAVVPLIMMAALMGVFIAYQSQNLIAAQKRAVEGRVLASKQAEIENYMALALAATRSPEVKEAMINQTGEFGENGPPFSAAQRAVKDVFDRLTFGEDGYFFVYDRKGVNLVHPKLPDLVGKDWWNLTDPNGDLVIQNLIKAAEKGGGFHRYVWNKPSTGEVEEKIAYAKMLEPWGWMFGTGLYIDDIALEVQAITSEIEANIRDTFTALFFLTVLATSAIAAVIYSVRLSEQRLADTKLKALTARIVSVQEDERKRVATELHDGISQLLIAVRYALDQAHDRAKERPEIQSVVQSSMTVLEDAISEVRRISKDLRPSILDDMGLAAAIKSLATDFSARTGIAISVNAERTETTLSDSAKTALYRVVQEALTNVAKHSEAQAVAIDLKRGSNEIILDIEDDGKGLKPVRQRGAKTPLDLAQSGLGVRNMRERVEAHGGVFAFLPAKNQGAHINVRLPVLSEAILGATA